MFYYRIMMLLLLSLLLLAATNTTSTQPSKWRLSSSNDTKVGLPDELAARGNFEANRILLSTVEVVRASFEEFRSSRYVIGANNSNNIKTQLEFNLDVECQHLVCIFCET